MFSVFSICPVIINYCEGRPTTINCRADYKQRFSRKVLAVHCKKLENIVFSNFFWGKYDLSAAAILFYLLITLDVAIFKK